MASWLVSRRWRNSLPEPVLTFINWDNKVTVLLHNKVLQTSRRESAATVPIADPHQPLTPREICRTIWRSNEFFFPSRDLKIKNLINTYPWFWRRLHTYIHKRTFQKVAMLHCDVIMAIALIRHVSSACHNTLFQSSASNVKPWVVVVDLFPSQKVRLWPVHDIKIQYQGLSMGFFTD